MACFGFVTKVLLHTRRKGLCEAILRESANENWGKPERSTL
jgi:hypothetical protein